jgi:hypothetical protein
MTDINNDNNKNSTVQSKDEKYLKNYDRFLKMAEMWPATLDDEDEDSDDDEDSDCIYDGGGGGGGGCSSNKKERRFPVLSKDIFENLPLNLQKKIEKEQDIIYYEEVVNTTTANTKTSSNNASSSHNINEISNKLNENKGNNF